MLRKLTLRYDMFYYIVYKSLKQKGLYLFFNQRVQALQPDYALQRIESCQWFKAKILQYSIFLWFLLSTDKARFKQNGEMGIQLSKHTYLVG